MKPQAFEYGAVSLMLKLFGGLLLLPALLVMLVHPGYGLIGAIPGAAFLAVGWGLGAYRMWAWYGAVVTLLPISLAMTALVFWAGASGVIGLTTLTVPSVSLYVMWVLLSRGGRAHYRATSEAIARARANPASLAGRAYRRR